MVSTTSDSRGSTTAGQHGATDGGSMECQVISAGNRWRTWCPDIRCMGCDKVLSNEDADHDEHTDEAQGVKAGFVPLKPSAAEVERHRISHYPYRRWCRECVEGQAVGEGHRSSPS